jgi:hypothetical protein
MIASASLHNSPIGLIADVSTSRWLDRGRPWQPLTIVGRSGKCSPICLEMLGR